MAIPRALSAVVYSLSVVAPAFWASLMIGRTLAANRSASAETASRAILRAIWSLGFPRVTPRAFAAARACRVRVNQRALLLGESGKEVEDEGVNVRAEFGDQEGHLVSHKAADEVNIATEAVQPRHRLVAAEFPRGG